MNEWTLRYDAKPVTMNQIRTGGGDHWTTRRAQTQEWRETFGWLARSERIPPLEWMTVTVQHHCHRGPLADAGACMPSVKAAIDGLVDAGVIPDDDPEYLSRLTFLTPDRAKTAGLTLIVSGVIA